MHIVRTYTCDGGTGTVVSEDSIAQAVQQFKTSREFRSDRIGHIHVPVGKVSVLYYGVGSDMVCVHGT